jgi:putative membrane-bound dehydrogenase-like protein
MDRHLSHELWKTSLVSSMLFGCLAAAGPIDPASPEGTSSPSAALSSAPEPFPAIVNTQPGKDGPPSPEEARAAITFGDGDPNWRVTLFAAEPDVQQPIAFDFDDRGRVWVAECYSYSGGPYDQQHRDRVIILEDTDGDGRHDQRTVFWDRGWMLTGLTWGFGGLWILNNGTLAFLPDHNGDDLPDGEPVVLLDGWTFDAGHNFVNGLLWGPDGWLYGRHGITDTSFPGIPGTPQEQRTPMNCGIWRFHPVDHRFEIVCRGTTNPWGLDYDEHGQFFFTNNVIGHLWHVIPGAHYKRMFGVDFDPHLYELIDQHADHYHWDTTGNWTESREGVANTMGGGHSHCGGMIYLGDNWPERYRGRLFTCNTHGRRINCDRLERHGSGYIARHEPDVLLANQPWFRGIDLKTGPDGGVYVTDWVDNGECHDHDGVHRTSGRIYKVVYGRQTEPAETVDLASLSHEQLVERLASPNEWHVRRAQRLLQERALRGELPETFHKQVMKWRDGPGMTDRLRLRLLWVLSVTGGCDEHLLTSHLTSPIEDDRVWAIRLLVEQGAVSQDVLSALMTRTGDASALVRLTVASALQRLPLDDRWSIAEKLASMAGDATDHNLPLMLWYGIEPAVPRDPARAVQLARTAQIPLLRQYVARRLASDWEPQRDAIEELLAAAVDRDDAFAADILRGLSEALAGVPRVAPPEQWERTAARLAAREDEFLRQTTQELSVIFGDGRAMEALLSVAVDEQASRQSRAAAIASLVEARADGFADSLLKLIPDRIVQEEVLTGLAAFDHPQTAERIVALWGRIRAESRDAAITTLASRPHWAGVLLEAVGSGTIEASLITAVHARQILSLGDAHLKDQLESAWGVIDRTDEQKLRDISQWTARLTDAVLASADLAHGRSLFKQTCGTCHKLYGDGGQIGPDLTGSNRHNLGYLLENILDPNRAVPRQWTTTTILLDDGRVINGVVLRQTDQVWTVQTAKEELTIPVASIEESQASHLSLMPEGQLNPYSEADVRDLIGYLQSRQQVSPAE